MQGRYEAIAIDVAERSTKVKEDITVHMVKEGSKRERSVLKDQDNTKGTVRAGMGREGEEGRDKVIQTRRNLRSRVADR